MQNEVVGESRIGVKCQEARIFLFHLANFQRASCHFYVVWILQTSSNTIVMLISDMVQLYTFKRALYDMCD